MPHYPVVDVRTYSILKSGGLTQLILIWPMVKWPTWKVYDILSWKECCRLKYHNHLLKWLETYADILIVWFFKIKLLNGLNSYRIIQDFFPSEMAMFRFWMWKVLDREMRDYKRFTVDDSSKCFVFLFLKSLWLDTGGQKWNMTSVGFYSPKELHPQIGL